MSRRLSSSLVQVKGWDPGLLALHVLAVSSLPPLAGCAIDACRGSTSAWLCISVRCTCVCKHGQAWLGAQEGSLEQAGRKLHSGYRRAPQRRWGCLQKGEGVQQLQAPPCSKLCSAHLKKEACPAGLERV